MNYYIKVQNKNRKNDWCYWEIDWENYMIRPIKVSPAVPKTTSMHWSDLDNGLPSSGFNYEVLTFDEYFLEQL